MRLDVKVKIDAKTVILARGRCMGFVSWGARQGRHPELVGLEGRETGLKTLDILGCAVKSYNLIHAP
jgi:hypothetical protein